MHPTAPEPDSAPAPSGALSGAPSDDTARAPGTTPVENPLRACSLHQLRRRTSMKWRTYDPDVLPLWVAEMDVPLAEPVARALHEAIRASDTGYPVARTYTDALAVFTRDRWGWELPSERTALVPDVMLGIVELMKLITRPGDPVVVNSPVYTPFYQFLTHLDRRVVEAPLTPDGRLDPATLRSAFARATGTRGTRAAYLLCNPHNPTGTVHTAAELAEATRLAAAHGVRVVADEIHAPLVLPGARHTPYLTVPGTERAFSVMSASKGWNLAGLNAALAVAGADAADELAAMPEEVSHGPSHLGVIAHAAALRHGTGWLDALLAGLDENRRLLARLLADRLPEVRYLPGEGTFLAWLDCRALGLGDDPAAAFLERGRVALNSGPAFGTGGAGYARLNLATSPEILTEAVRRMASAV